MTTIEEAIIILSTINSMEDKNQLTILGNALQTIFQSPHPEYALDALFSIFERFPNSDGYGVFWTILHGVETLPNYEDRLIKSVRLQPMEFNLIMINRIINSGITTVNDTHLLELLKEIAGNSNYTQEARGEAERLLQRHIKRV